MLARALHNNLRAAIARRDTAEVDALLQRLSEVDPDSVHTRGLALDWLVARQRWPEAQRVARELVARFPDSARVHWLAGRAAYGSRDYRAALAAFRESDRLRPLPSVRRWIGKALTQLGDLDAAEPVLRDVGAAAALDLAWVYERRGEHDQARSLIDRHLADHPDDGFAQEARQRLVARAMDAGEVLDELSTLEALGESVPAGLAAEAFRHLLETGRGAEASALAERHLEGARLGEVRRWAWIAYKAEALDMACDLFRRVFDRDCRNPKFMAAYERAAKAAGRVAELVRACEARAGEVPQLWGRINRLRPLLPDEG
jgi:tetratricopeptide (TPR) repeat protein